MRLLVLRLCRGVVFLLLGLVLGIILLVALTQRENWLERLFIFAPSRTMVAHPQQVSGDLQEVFFSTADGLQLHGWYLPAGDKAPVVLWCQGNGGNLSYEVERLLLVRGAGLGVFVFDYRGYGLSQGQPSETGVYQDARAAYQHLTEVLGVPATRLVLMGRSLGGAVAAALAQQAPARALVLESTFTNIAGMARYLFPWVPGAGRWAHKFDNLTRVSLLALPKLIIHGDRDQVVPFSMGEQLYRAAAPPKEFYRIPGAGHEDTFEVGGQEYLERLVSFIRQASEASPQEEGASWHKH